MAGQPVHLDERAGRRWFLVPLILLLAARIPWASPLGRCAGPGLALAFLGVTGVLLIWDLRHPKRFYLIFTRHHWRSWLVRGSFIIGAYGGAAAAYLAARWPVRWPPSR